MSASPKGTESATSNLRLLLPYVAELELEVDRLRRQAHFVQGEIRRTLKRIEQSCRDASQAQDVQAPLADIDQAVTHLLTVLRELQELPGYHPAHDQVVAIAVRPLAEQVFRWQQRLLAAPQAVLRLDLEAEHVEWFPARLRHILDNLVSNALKYRDPDKAECWVHVALRVSPEAYQFRVSDNGVGLDSSERRQVFDLFYRAAPARAAGLGVGLPVAKLLIEQSAGSLDVDSRPGQGTTFVAVLPRYPVDDFLM